ncbi:hypothetical protein QCD58_004577 [Enterobacter hormaechei]|nr:hypothetical protein [Enterobacter hormaechei]
MKSHHDLHARLAEIRRTLMASRFDRLNNIPLVRHLMQKLVREKAANPDTISCVAYLLRTDTIRGKRIADSPATRAIEIMSLAEQLANLEKLARIPSFNDARGFLDPEDLASMAEIIRKEPEGIVLRYGPAWSGMSSTQKIS